MLDLAGVFCVQLVVLEEGNKLTLPGPKDHLTCELVNAQALDDIKDVNLKLQLLLSVFLQPVFSSGFRSTT